MTKPQARHPPRQKLILRCLREVGCVAGERRSKQGKDAGGAAWQSHASRRGRRHAPERRRQTRTRPTEANAQKMRLAETLGCLPCA
jgi:hypothetical protein